MKASFDSLRRPSDDRSIPAEFAWPADYAGLLSLPGGRRMVWWTGRVAIGLLHEQRRPPQTSSGDWVQTLLLRGAIQDR